MGSQEFLIKLKEIHGHKKNSPPPKSRFCINPSAGEIYLAQDLSSAPNSSPSRNIVGRYIEEQLWRFEEEEERKNAEITLTAQESEDEDTNEERECRRNKYPEKFFRSPRHKEKQALNSEIKKLGRRHRVNITAEY